MWIVELCGIVIRQPVSLAVNRETTMKHCVTLLAAMLVVGTTFADGVSAADPDGEHDGFVTLFDGASLSGWVVPEGDNGHWKVVDGVIDYDAQSEAQGEKHLWTEKEYGDFILKIDWRIKRTTGLYSMPIVLADGTHLTDATGKEIKIDMPNADSGIYVRGSSKAQLNIWCWPIGSGEVYGYRMNKSMPPEVRAGVTPKVNADKPVGEWNQFIIFMIGDRLTVLLNGKTVLENAQLPDVPATGRIALQHHGGVRNGQYSPASSLMQFRNIRIKELPRPVEAADE